MDVDLSEVDKISAEICRSYHAKAKSMITQSYKKYGELFVATFLEYMDVNYVSNYELYINELVDLISPETLKYGSSFERFIYIMYFATPDDFIDVLVSINESCFNTIYTHTSIRLYMCKYGTTTVIDILDTLAALNKDAHLILILDRHMTVGMYDTIIQEQHRIVDLLRKYQNSFHTSIFIKYILIDRLYNIVLSGSETAIIMFLLSKTKNVRHKMIQKLRKRHPKLYYRMRKVWKDLAS